MKLGSTGIRHQALGKTRKGETGGGLGFCAGKIGVELGHSASRLSFHLGVLEQAGLIKSRRVARNVIYSADFAGLGSTISYLLRDCCMDHPQVHDCCRRALDEDAIPMLSE